MSSPKTVKELDLVFWRHWPNLRRLEEWKRVLEILESNPPGELQGVDYNREYVQAGKVPQDEAVVTWLSRIDRAKKEIYRLELSILWVQRLMDTCNDFEKELLAAYYDQGLDGLAGKRNERLREFKKAHGDMPDISFRNYLNTLLNRLITYEMKDGFS